MKSSTASHARLLPFLILLIALPGASAQLAPVRMAPLNEPLETYDNPPAPPAKMETSPRMISQFGVFTSYQANVDQMARTSSAMLRTSALFRLIPQTATR